MQRSKNLFILTTLMHVCVVFGFAQSEQKDDVIRQIQKISSALTLAETNDNIEEFLGYYEKNAISLPDYQRLLAGVDEIGPFYHAIFNRQIIRTYHRKIDKILSLDETTIAEIGTFKKEFTTIDEDSVLIHDGKYCYIWNLRSDSSFKVKGEIFGFFHPVTHPKSLVVDLQTSAGESEIHLESEIPIELRAYNALMEKYVKNGEGALRAQFFTNDGIFMPFAHPTVTGIDELKPYLIAYDTHGKDFKFDSISVYTYHFEYFENYVLEYPKFKVRWSTPSLSGSAEGKSLRIWKRQKDGSLKLFLEISTHNFIP